MLSHSVFYSFSARNSLFSAIVYGSFFLSFLTGFLAFNPALVMAHTDADASEQHTETVTDRYTDNHTDHVDHEDSDTHDTHTVHDTHTDDDGQGNLHSDCHAVDHSEHSTHDDDAGTTTKKHDGGENGDTDDHDDTNDDDCGGTHQPPPVPHTGSITVCKIIVDTDGAISDGSTYGTSTFTIAGVTMPGEAGILPTTNFNTPLALDTTIIDQHGAHDAQCVKYSDLALGHYYYGQEHISGSGWQAPKYNDQYMVTVHSLADFYPYDGKLFAPGGDTNNSRNQNANGDITLSADRPDRTLVILNTHEKLIVPPPVATSCFLPDTEGAPNIATVNSSGANGEPTLADVLSHAGIHVTVASDQKGYQEWKTAEASTTVTVDATFLAKYAANTNIFGYYVNGDLSTFTPLFREGNSTTYASVPIATQGQQVSFTLSATTTRFAFAIKSESGSTTYTWATENALNIHGEQHAVVYDAGTASSYVLAFEDLPFAVSDRDYNDMVVEVHICHCGTAPPVHHDQPPVITLKGQNPLTLTVDTPYSEPGATVADPQDGDITDKLAISGTVATDTIGTYTIFYNATDTEGLAAEQVTRTVKVVEAPNPGCTSNCGGGGGSTAQPPTITLLGDNPMSITQGASFTDPGAVAHDPQDGDITSKIVETGSVDTSVVGTTTLHYNVKDSQGLSAPEVMRTVVVHSQPNQFPGSIRMCKMYEHGGTLATSSAGLPDGVFSLDLTSGTTSVGVATFNASTFAPNAKNILAENDSDCETFSNLPLGTYRYSQESLHGTATSSWLMPKYNDEEVTPVNNTSDFFAYNADATTTDPNADGIITLDLMRTTRTLVVLNTYDMPPVITLKGDNPMTLTLGTVYVEPGATVHDLEDGDITNKLVISGAVATGTIGTYTVTYNATDTQGIPASQVSRTVTVVAAPGCTSNCGGSGGGTPAPTPSCTSNCGGGGGGGGGGPPPAQLVITNEAIARISRTVAQVTWNTNIPAVSRVVYDTTSHVAVLGPANFGYAYTSATTIATSTSHTIIVTDLNLDTTAYHFLPASYADNGLFAVGTELILAPGTATCTSNCGGGTGGGMPAPTSGSASSAPIAPASCAWYLNDFIHVGWNNNSDEVKKLQIFLRTFESESSVAVNGVYDQATVDAADRFQEKYFNDVLAPWGLTSHTHFVYITTRQEINNIYCNVHYPFTQAQLDEIAKYREYLKNLPAGIPASDGIGAGEVGTAAGTSVSRSSVAARASGAETGNSEGDTTSTTSVGNGFAKRSASLASGIANVFSSLPSHLSTLSWLPILILILIAVLAIYLLKSSTAHNESLPNVPQPPANPLGQKKPETVPLSQSQPLSKPSGMPPIILPGASDHTRSDQSQQQK